MGRLSDTIRSIRMADGDGIGFYCPGCGSMHVVPINGSKAWGYNGNPDSPTLTPSVKVTSQDGVCHFFLTDGRLNYCGDSTHALPNQSARLPTLPPEYADG